MDRLAEIEQHPFAWWEEYGGAESDALPDIEWLITQVKRQREALSEIIANGHAEYCMGPYFGPDRCKCAVVIAQEALDD